MLSYQHSFHAGNHADVLKHITLCALLSKLTAKSKPFFYLDTHAGSGCYEIGHGENHDLVIAAKLPNNNDTPNVVKSYLDIIQPFLDKSCYPGSPVVADEAITLFSGSNEALQNAVDKSNLQLNELHPSAFETLQRYMKPSYFNCHQRDGFELLNALMPPKPNRGIVLIDPPYEQAKEYKQVLDSIASAIQKWPSGIFCIWYPLLSPERVDRQTNSIQASPKHGLSEEMLLSLTKIAKDAGVGLLDIKFALQSPSPEMGMYGSGMVIFSPPWQVDKCLEEIRLYMKKHVQKDENNISAVNWLAPAP